MFHSINWHRNKLILLVSIFDWQSIAICFPFYLPIINSAAVRCELGGPVKLVAPNATPPKAHATPPSATTAITALNGGPANHCPQHPFPERSDGDLKIKNRMKFKFRLEENKEKH